MSSSPTEYKVTVTDQTGKTEAYVVPLRPNPHFFEHADRPTCMERQFRLSALGWPRRALEEAYPMVMMSKTREGAGGSDVVALQTRVKAVKRTTSSSETPTLLATTRQGGCGWMCSARPGVCFAPAVDVLCCPKMEEGSTTMTSECAIPFCGDRTCQAAALGRAPKGAMAATMSPGPNGNILEVPRRIVYESFVSDQTGKKISLRRPLQPYAINAMRRYPDELMTFAMEEAREQILSEGWTCCARPGGGQCTAPAVNVAELPVFLDKNQGSTIFSACTVPFCGSSECEKAVLQQVDQAATRLAVMGEYRRDRGMILVPDMIGSGGASPYCSAAVEMVST